MTERPVAPEPAGVSNKAQVFQASNDFFSPQTYAETDYTPSYSSGVTRDLGSHTVPPQLEVAQTSLVMQQNAKAAVNWNMDYQPYSYYNYRLHRVPDAYGGNDSNPYVEFSNRYFANHEYSKLADYFLSQFYRVHQTLNDYVIQLSGGTHDVALDDTLIEDIYGFLQGNDRVYPTPENGEILLSRFLDDRRQEYAATLKRIWDNRRICYEKLWTRQFPLPVSSRNEDYTPPDAAIRYQLMKPTLYRRKYLEAIGVGVPRNRVSW